MLNSFLMAGFDCTHGRNVHGAVINNRVATLHSDRLDEDYRMVAQAGIRVIRDGAPWPDVQSGPGRFDWTALDAIVAAARRQHVDILHDFCHFGVPEHVDVFSRDFVGQFADFCYRATRRIDARSDRPILITPLNEPSYYAWAAADAALFPPYCRERAFELKVQFAQAILAGIDAIWAAAPRATIVNVDPICRTVAPLDRPELEEVAAEFNHCAVYESFDLISGRLLPELGGSQRHLGIVGVNYYWTNQWELGSENVALLPDDPRAVPLSFLLAEVWERYGADIIISESGHIGDHREAWARQLTSDVATTLERGIPLRGVCLYPILGMPSWHEPETWLPMGMWDVVEGERMLHQPMFDALSELRLLRATSSQEARMGDETARLEEYKTLRDETLRRIDARNQTLSYTLAFAAAMFTLGLGKDGFSAALLVYSIVAFFFATSFSHSSLMLIQIGQHIRGIEQKTPGLEWATKLRPAYPLIEFFELVSTTGLFIGTQVIGIVFYCGLPPDKRAAPETLLWSAIAACVLTAGSCLYPWFHHRKILSKA